MKDCVNLSDWGTGDAAGPSCSTARPHDQQAERRPGEGAGEPATAGRPPLGLVLDDEYLIALSVAETLIAGGFQALVTATADEALEALRTSPVDFAIIDLMPDAEDNRTLVGAMRDRELPFAFCTGSLLEHVESQFPGTPILGKPFHDREVVELAASLAAERAGIDK